MEAADKKAKKQEKEEDEEEEVGSEEEEEEEEPETFDENPAMLDKYKTAATIAGIALKHVTKLCVAGADISDICAEGDKKVDEEVPPCLVTLLDCQGLLEQEDEGEREGQRFPNVP